MKTRKALALALALTILLGLSTSAFALTPEAGAQTQSALALDTADSFDDAEEIIYLESAEDLLSLAESCRLDSWSDGKLVILTADISLSQTDFSPIASFAGVFDGNGHTISDLCLTQSVLPAGLFGELQAGGVIHDLTVSGTIAPAGDAQFVGGIVGENYGQITRCSFTGNLLGASNTGGIAGVNALTGRITDCEVSGLVIGSSMTGGIAGCNLGVIEDAVNKAYVNTTSVDPSLDPSQINFDFLTDISKLKSLDLTSAAIDSGGIAGYSSGIVRGCVNKASVGYPHIGYNVGGIVGRSCGFLDDCTNTAEIFGRKDTGGIAGQLEPYISLNLSESELARLERQLSELDALLDATGQHAQSASSELTDRLNALSGCVSSAASAAQDIRLTGGIASTVLADAVHSSDSDLTLTPFDGSVEGGISLGEGELAAGLEAAVSKGIEAGREAEAHGIVDAQTQIDLKTDLAGLSSALSGMAGQMRMLTGALGGASQELLDDAALLHDKVDEITQTGFDMLMNTDEEDTVVDKSAVNIDEITLGKVYACSNSGAVHGDINVGGIAGVMGLEYTLDPEDDLSLSLDPSTKRQYELRALVQRCKNLGQITAKRNHAGGIAGKMDLGLIAQCESYGSVSSESGNYVGGIAGICSATIRHSFSKCTLSGGKYIGGIVGSGVEESKSGVSSTVAGCYSMVTISDHEQYIGAISGADAGDFLENRFVSSELAGINGVSRAGCAEPLSYDELLARFSQAEAAFNAPAAQVTAPAAAQDASAEASVGEAGAQPGDASTEEDPTSQEEAADDDHDEALSSDDDGLSADYDFSMELPEEFQRFNLKFVADGALLYADVFDYGASFGEDIFPEIPPKDGYYAYWDKETLESLDFDTTVTAVYEPYSLALASEDTRTEDRPIFLAEGAFSADDTLQVSAMALTPEAFDLAGGVWDIICKSLRDRTLNTEVVEQWQLRLSAGDEAAHTIRYLPPNGDAKHMRIYVLENGTWSARDTELIGSYIAFPIQQADVQLAVVHCQNVWWAWLIVAALVLPALFFLLRPLYRRLRQRKAEDSALALRLAEVTASELSELPDTTDAPDTPDTPAAHPSLPASKKKRRWLLALALGGAVLLGILATAAFFLFPELMADFGAYEAVKACAEQKALTMELSGEVRLGAASYPLSATLERTSVGGQRVSSIREHARTLYYADGAVFLEDGSSYRVDASLPDYSQLLELCVALFQHTDTEATQNSYTLTAQGADAKAILKLLLPASATELSETESLRVTLTTQNRVLSSLSFSGSGQVNDAAHTAYTLEATLRPTDAAPGDIPTAVKEAIAAGIAEDAPSLTQELCELADAWQKLNSQSPLTAALTLSADCGPLVLSEQLELSRWAQAGAPIYCIRENGFGLYFSGQTICDSSGNSVPLASASNAGAVKLLDILYPLFLHASADCTQAGAQRVYTLRLDADGMEALACAIAPELEKLDLSFTSGTAQLVMQDGSIQSIHLSIDASAQIVLARTDASVSASLEFLQDASPAQLPEAVKKTLPG